MPGHLRSYIVRRSSKGTMCGMTYAGSNSSIIKFGINEIQKVIKHPAISDVIFTSELLLYQGYLHVIYG